jgi:hypothetical protein
VLEDRLRFVAFNTKEGNTGSSVAFGKSDRLSEHVTNDPAAIIEFV